MIGAAALLAGWTALAAAQAASGTQSAQAGSGGKKLAGFTREVPKDLPKKDGMIVLRHPLDDKPLDVPLPEGDKLTKAVQHFHETGENLYLDAEEPVAVGKKLYDRLCASCHLPDGTGRIGPSLVDDEIRYPRNDTVVGMFETIYAGAAGAMQPFRSRMSQDEILKTIAYIEKLNEEHGS